METSNERVWLKEIWPSFDPTEKSGEDVLLSQVRALAEHPIVSAILDSAHITMLIVNRHLQIVSANTTGAELLAKKSGSLIGARFGDALGCVNAGAGEGCGTSAGCSACGATRCVLESMHRKETTEGECVISSGADGLETTSEYSVRATPIPIPGHYLTAVALQDISDSKRLKIMERVFVHDLKNTLSGLVGWSDTLAEERGIDAREAAERIAVLSRRLAREVEDHRVLISVEANEYVPRIETVLPVEVLEELEAAFAYHPLAKNKRLERQEPVPDVEIKTDSAVLFRVLTNMMTNALEATDEGDSVRFGCELNGGSCKFYVRNNAAISSNVAMRIFQRSFSTKSVFGRGLGTYSMKLFGERVLKGKVSFESEDDKGTTFYLDLPAEHKD